MPGRADHQDQKESRRIALFLVAFVVLALAAALFLLPALSGLISQHLSPGLGLKDGAVIAFFLTLALMLVFAMASGDGLLAEIEFMLGGFFLFFVIFWLMISWIF
jgi:hypothetical protein